MRVVWWTDGMKREDGAQWVWMWMCQQADGAKQRTLQPGRGSAKSLPALRRWICNYESFTLARSKTFQAIYKYFMQLFILLIICAFNVGSSGLPKGRARPFSLYTSPARGLQKINSQQSSEKYLLACTGQTFASYVERETQRNLKKWISKKFQ